MFGGSGGWLAAGKEVGARSAYCIFDNLCWEVSRLCRRSRGYDTYISDE
jgi:hypothetical protein